LDASVAVKIHDDNRFSHLMLLGSFRSLYDVFAMTRLKLHAQETAAWGCPTSLHEGQFVLALGVRNG
jgi:hypothetical protein